MVHAVREGAGPSVVFSVVFTHGPGGSLGTWGHQAEALRRRFTVVRWELPGHGRSPAGPPGALTGDGPPASPPPTTWRGVPAG